MHTKDLAKHTRKELLAVARQRGLKGVSRLRKKDLLERVAQALSSRPSPASPLSSPSSPVTKKSGRTSKSRVTVTTPPSAADSLSTQPSLSPTDLRREQPEREAADSKFFLGPQPHSAAPPEPDTLPASYDDNRIVLLARDPYWLYAYWDFNGERWSQAQSRRDAGDARLVLRLFDVTYIEFNGANAWGSADVEITPFATSWYVPVPRADAAYCVEIGYRSRAGQFASLGRSNVITTPRADLSPSATVRWLTPPERRTAQQQSGRTARSAFAQTDSSQLPDEYGASRLPSPSSAEHPFSWGAVRKL